LNSITNFSSIRFKNTPLASLWPFANRAKAARPASAGAEEKETTFSSYKACNSIRSWNFSSINYRPSNRFIIRKFRFLPLPLWPLQGYPVLPPYLSKGATAGPLESTGRHRPKGRVDKPKFIEALRLIICSNPSSVPLALSPEGKGKCILLFKSLTTLVNNI
jgi:hypothetical protein